MDFHPISVAALAITGTVATSCIMAPITGPNNPRALAATLPNTIVIETMMLARALNDTTHYSTIGLENPIEK